MNIPSGVIRVKGTEYVVRADGSVTVVSGSIDVRFNLPGNGGSVFVTVPAGYSGLLPVGISFMGPAWTERKLIAYAYSFEQATKARHAPEFKPSYAVRDFIPRSTHVGSVRQTPARAPAAAPARRATKATTPRRMLPFL